MIGRKKDCSVQGSVAPGFESVRALYEKTMGISAESNTQLCVYYKGEKVVDLWATTINDQDFSADSLVNIFSSGKSLESLAIASLVDRGLVNYDSRITDYWPEFGSHGKGELTVADLMRHEAGLVSFDTSVDPDALLTENLKKNATGQIIEKQSQRYAGGEGERREYHAVTRGWIANELFRRCDPGQRTIGEFLREDINAPLEVEAIMGLKEEELPRRSRVSPLGLGFHFLQSLRPKFLGRRVVHNVFQILGRIIRILPAIRREMRSPSVPPLKGMMNVEIFNSREIAMGETPSANTHSSARSLARIAAMLSGRGTFLGTSFLGPRGWEALHDHPVKADMGGLFTTAFTQGGVNEFNPCTADSQKLERDFNVGREGFYGWMGLGGSIFQWHPALDIGFGFVPTSLHVLDLFNERGKAYQAEVLQCIGQLGNDSNNN